MAFKLHDHGSEKAPTGVTVHGAGPYAGQRVELSPSPLGAVMKPAGGGPAMASAKKPSDLLAFAKSQRVHPDSPVHLTVDHKGRPLVSSTVGIETGPRGGQFTRSSSGAKIYKK